MRNLVHFIKLTILGFLFFLAKHSYAGIPDDYSPVIIEPPFSFSKRVIDLTESVNKSKSSGKPILLYLGAADCPPCRQYERFLIKNADQMKPILSEYVFADIRTWLKGSTLYVKVNGEETLLVDWRAKIGDSRTGLFYPTWWLLDSNLKQLKQIPSGSTNFLSVKRHIETLSLNN